MNKRINVTANDMDVKMQSKLSQKNEKKKKRLIDSLFTIVIMLKRIASGEWQTVNDKNQVGVKQQFIDSNVALSLVCALLFSTFLPLYYAEASSINIEGTGLAYDMTLSYLNQHNLLTISAKSMHDVILFIYLMSMAGALFGTIMSVFFMMTANEVSNDAKAFVLLTNIGSLISLPYHFFVISIVAWGTGVYIKCVLVSRTLWGLIICFVGPLGILASLLVIGTYVNFWSLYVAEEVSNSYKPIVLTDSDIEVGLRNYFENIDEKSMSLDDFLQTLTISGEVGYVVPIHMISRLKATRRFYSEIANILDCPVSDVIRMVGPLSSITEA